MYSHGSSARAGGGKRGHGGRPYRPPREKRGDSYPPPLKECDCLIELDLDEYRQLAPQRLHAVFGGRQGMEKLVKQIRSVYQCHVEIPGRRQSGGPVAIVGRTLGEAIPAAACLIQSMNNINQVRGRIRRSVKNPGKYPVVQGTFHKRSDSEVWWLFQPDENSSASSGTAEADWSVLACQLEDSSKDPPPNDKNTNDQSNDSIHRTSAPAAPEISNGGAEGNDSTVTSRSSPLMSNDDSNSQDGGNDDGNGMLSLDATMLQTCWDNVQFRCGSQQLEQLKVFFDSQQPMMTMVAFCCGPTRQVELLYREIIATIEGRKD